MTHGSIQRFKPINNVIEEIRFIKENYHGRFFNFTDDNFLNNIDYYTLLLKALAKEDIKFHCELSTQIINKPQLLPLLKQAGCVSAFIGLESLRSDNLNFVNKKHNQTAKYNEIFNLFAKHEIPLNPAFLFGFDYDDKNVFCETLNFLKSVSVQRITFGLITPFPGTQLYNEMEKQKRLISHNFSLYDGFHVVSSTKEYYYRRTK